MVCVLKCPPPHSLLLALKKGRYWNAVHWSNTDLYFSPYQNCYWSHLLELSHVTFTFFAFQHFFSHWTVSHPEDGSNAFLPNVTTSTQSPPRLQHPLCKPENLHDNSCCHLSNSCYWSRQYRIRGPKRRKGHEESAWECCMKLSSCIMTVAMDTRMCWNWTLSIARSWSVCCAVWLTVGAGWCLEVASV